MIAVLALIGCGEPVKDEPQQFIATEGEDAYQTAVFAEQRAKWQALAEQGDARSQAQLGMMYYLGQGIDVDYAVAHEWLTKAAVQGDAVAQMTLGVMNREGHGVPQNNVRAHMWLSISAQQGNPNASIHLEGLAPKMSEDEIAEAQKLAEEWKPSF
jgi:TPR repeat protein